MRVAPKWHRAAPTRCRAFERRTRCSVKRLTFCLHRTVMRGWFGQFLIFPKPIWVAAMTENFLTRAQAFEESEDVGRNPTDNPTIGDVIAARFSRRDILKGALGVAAIAATVSPLALAAAGERACRSGVALPLRRDRGRRRREPSRRRRLRRRRPDPLGRSGAAGRAGVRSAAADRRRAAAAVRLQQRLPRLFPDAGRGQSVAARPARGQPRIHQRGADVPRPRRGRTSKDAALRRDDARSSPTSRWPRMAAR